MTAAVLGIAGCALATIGGALLGGWLGVTLRPIIGVRWTRRVGLLVAAAIPLAAIVVALN